MQEGSGKKQRKWQGCHVDNSPMEANAIVSFSLCSLQIYTLINIGFTLGILGSLCPAEAARGQPAAVLRWMVWWTPVDGLSLQLRAPRLVS